MEYDLSLKRSDILIHASMWMNFENMLKKSSQSQKTDLLYDFIYMKCPSWQIYRDRKDIGDFLTLGVGVKGCGWDY